MTDTERKVARALADKPVLTLEDLVAATSLDEADVRGVLQAFVKAGLVSRTVMNSGSCRARGEPTGFFYARTKAGVTAFEKA